jgi:hypothetical protein
MADSISKSERGLLRRGERPPRNDKIYWLILPLLRFKLGEFHKNNSTYARKNFTTEHTENTEKR